MYYYVLIHIIIMHLGSEPQRKTIVVNERTPFLLVNSLDIFGEISLGLGIALW